jgi:hypothetical protein
MQTYSKRPHYLCLGRIIMANLCYRRSVYMRRLWGFASLNISTNLLSSILLATIFDNIGFHMHLVVIYHLLIHFSHPPSPHPFQCWHLATRHQVFVDPTLNWGNGGRYSFQIIWNYSSCPIVSGKDCRSRSLLIWTRSSSLSGGIATRKLFFIILTLLCVHSHQSHDATVTGKVAIIKVATSNKSG